jgi:hypothetical protein
LRLQISQLAGATFVAGATLGSAVRSRAIAETSGMTDEILFLDFSGIDAATGSFLREAILGLRDSDLIASRNLAVAVANPSELVAEEFGELLSRVRDVVLCCRLGADETPSNPFLLGALEDAQRRALAAVLKAGSTDAATLAAMPRSEGDPDKIGATGWNNRLASLAAKGILRETRRGRTKTYRPTVEGLTLGR